MRVLHIHKAGAVSGSEKHLLTLLPLLIDRGVDAQLCGIDAPESDAFATAVRAAGIPLHLVPFRGNPSLRTVSELRRLIADVQPDIVHTHLIHADLYGQLATRWARVPGISSVHGTGDTYRSRSGLGAAKTAGRLAARTIAISEFVRDFLGAHHIVADERIEVVHYGIDVDAWTRPPDVRAEARARFGVGSDAVVVGVGSRLIPNKGHEQLIHAVARANHDGAGLHLAIAGTGPLREDLEAFAGDALSADNVTFTGFVDDLAAFYAGCDFVAFPTLPEFGEGFGLAALEGMAAGCAVIASNIDSLPEVVGPDGAGFLVPPDDAGVWVDVLTRLGRNPALRRAVGAKAAARARHAFSPDVMANKTAAIYAELSRATPTRTPARTH